MKRLKVLLSNRLHFSKQRTPSENIQKLEHILSFMITSEIVSRIDNATWEAELNRTGALLSIKIYGFQKSEQQLPLGQKSQQKTFLC